MLKHWKQSKGTGATYQALSDELQHKFILRRDLAEKLCYTKGMDIAVASGEPSGQIQAEQLKGSQSQIVDAVEKLKAVESECKDVENRLKERQEALKKSSNKQPSGKKKKNIKKMKNSSRETLGTLTIKLDTTGGNKLRDRMKRHATIGLDCFPLSTLEELQRFCCYLRAQLNAEIKEKNAGSLILTVHCRTLEILERLWEDYCSGRLDTVAEECFLSDDERTKKKEEMGEESKDDADIVGLKTTISETEYLRCKTFLTEISGLTSLTDEENVAMEKITYKNILLKFYVLLLEKLDPNEVSHQLLTAGVLTSDDKEKIEENPSQKEKSAELLMILATKGPRAYEEFVKTLEKDQCSLACQLLKEGM
ncbi:uncharacterized protein LOC110059758 isoform X3 [Orbicella faveolata]|uniref:uncharacterized protein LOC110059758 isoform X3 n=1 Tax=Orbicella faveolata TaxID=48498 RepID=UPI0009E3F751|nr:uncharacterized protein LOC110059758 isoform X3 [Orbicella faveolata]